MEEWKEYKLGDLIVLSSGGTPNKSNSSYWGGDIPWISAKAMYDDYLYSSDITITREGLNNGSKLAPVNSILLLTRGSGLFNRIPVCLVKREMAFNQDVKCIESINQNIVSTLFLFYWLIGNKQEISNILETTGIGAGKIDTERLKSIHIKLPPILIQQVLIIFAESLMLKIEINRRINDNLEQQAQALFKSWFVDFEPFKDGEFVESELGKIPKGWKVLSLSTIANFLNGLAMQKYRPTGTDKGIPVLKIKELGQGHCDSSSDLCSTSIERKYKVENGDVIFSWSGTLLIDIWCGGLCGLNQHLFKVTSKDYPKWFFFLWTKEHLRNFIHIANDKAVTMGHIKRGHLDEAKVLAPPQNDLDKMTKTMLPIIEEIVKKKIECRKLAQLRDTLLPRLMSGKIKVGDLPLNN